MTLTWLGRIVRSGEARRKSVASLPTVANTEMAAGRDHGVVRVRYEDVDRPGRYLGCDNGVVDLLEGLLLPPNEGKRASVTLSTYIEYHEGAQHPHVDALCRYLEPDVAEFLKALLGQGLWGTPPDITLVLTGPSRGGKTTLLEAVRAAVGPLHYWTAVADVASRGGRYSGGRHTEDRRAIYTMRYCGIVEAENPTADTGKLKAMTGGDTAPFRAIHGRQTSMRPTALVIWAANKMPPWAWRTRRSSSGSGSSITARYRRPTGTRR